MAHKILFCATVDYHFQAFHLPILQWFKEQGWEVHVAANGEQELPFVDKKFTIPIQRSPFRLANLRAYSMLKSIIDEQGYSLIHCHTPMGGVLSRLAARNARKSGTKMLYTAHGFHFCKGAPLRNWLLYYPIEKQLSASTDCLITINSEDYRLALNKRFKAKQIKQVHGVGINMNRYKPVQEQDKVHMRERFGYRPEHFLLFYAAEFNGNKNHVLLIEALAELKTKAPHTRLLLAGVGPLLDDCRLLAAKLGVAPMINFLGYRHDIDSLLPMCDVAVSASLREGLPVNVMEAMACGLPVVATRNRGHEELIQEGRNGFIVDPKDASTFAARLHMLSFLSDMRLQMGVESVRIVQRFALEPVLEELKEIYMSQFDQTQDEMERLQWLAQ